MHNELRLSKSLVAGLLGAASSAFNLIWSTAKLMKLVANNSPTQPHKSDALVPA